MKLILKLFEENFLLLKFYKILIVANIRGKSGNYKSLKVRMANQNEFFSDSEFDEIYAAIQSLNLWTKVYFNELDLINDLLCEKYDTNKIIVFNFARNGVIEGKKSLIPVICDLLNIKYTTCNAFIQSLCRNKYIWGNVLYKEGLPVLSNVLISNGKIINNVQIDYDKLYISKPIAESSSIGISSADKINNILLKSNTNRLIAQRLLIGEEFEIPFFELNGEYYILNPTKIIYKNNILNETLSLTNDYYYDELELPLEQKEYFKNIVKKACQILNLKKYGRIDFKFDDKGKAYIIDIATLPYITKKSSFFYQFNKNNYSYNEIFKCLIVIALLSTNQKTEDLT